jgi:hypothetical protein
MGTRPRLRQSAEAAAGGDGAREARTGTGHARRPPRHIATAGPSDRPTTTGHPPLHPAGHSTKRQPATVGAEERAGEARRQGGRRRDRPPSAARHHLRTLALYLAADHSFHATNDLHCCQPARRRRRAASGGRPCSRPPRHSHPPRKKDNVSEKQTNRLRLVMTPHCNLPRLI